MFTQSIRCFFALTFLAATVAAGGCSSVKKANMEGAADPGTEIKKMQDEVQLGYTNHYDVLAKSDFDHAQEKLKQAAVDQEKGKSRDKVFDDLGYARGYLDRADARARNIQERAGGILEARTAALDAGARKYPTLVNSLKAHDDDLRRNIDDISSAKISPEKWSTLQANYLNLELAAIDKTRLDPARAKIRSAKGNGAHDYAPQSLADAEQKLQNAENVIATNRHDEGVIGPAVEEANQSASNLEAVLAATNSQQGRINEAAAIDLVHRGQMVKDLDQKLSAEKETSGVALNLDQALNDARNEFNADEAEVYRQGDNLLVRLKGVNFTFGRSELPTSSLPLLAKVRNIAEKLNPSEIVVQGHTDSVGNKKANQELSEARAESVATYLKDNGLGSTHLETVGKGFEKPLASNKTREGRAENRRVDIIIVPGKPMPGREQAF